MTNRLSSLSVVVMVVLGALALGAVVTLMPPTPMTFLGILAIPVVVYAFRRVPELALTLFLYAGFFKQAVPIPIDVTLLLAAATMILAVYLVGRDGLQPVPLAVWMFVGFVVVVAVGAGYSQEASYGIDKAARLASLGLITPLVTVQIVRDKASVERLAWSMLGFGLVMSLVAIAGGGDPRFYGKLAAFGSDTIALGRVAGYAAAIAAVSALRSVRHALYAAPVMAICGFALLGSGSRGSSARPCCRFRGVVLGASVQRRRWADRGGGSGRDAAIRRRSWIGLVARVIFGKGGANHNGRTGCRPDAYALARPGVELLEEDPLTGAGTGSYATYDPKFDYPHDFVLEVAADGSCSRPGPGFTRPGSSGGCGRCCERQ